MKIVVKGMDSKSIGFCPQGFEPPSVSLAVSSSRLACPCAKIVRLSRPEVMQVFVKVDNAASLHVDSLVCCSVLGGLGHVLAQWQLGRSMCTPLS